MLDTHARKNMFNAAIENSTNLFEVGWSANR